MKLIGAKENLCQLISPWSWEAFQMLEKTATFAFLAGGPPRAARSSPLAGLHGSGDLAAADGPEPGSSWPESSRIVDSTFSFPGSSAEPVLSCGGVRGLRALSAFFPFSLLLPFPPQASWTKTKRDRPRGFRKDIGSEITPTSSFGWRNSWKGYKHVHSPISLSEIKLCLWDSIGSGSLILRISRRLTMQSPRETPINTLTRC